MAKARTITLDERLREIAARGELTHLSLIPVAGKGTAPGGVVFSASYSPASTWGHAICTHPDPVEALMMAIDEKLPPERRRKPVEEAPPAVAAETVTDEFGL
jgi:hypothetical protein